MECHETQRGIPVKKLQMRTFPHLHNSASLELKPLSLAAWYIIDFLKGDMRFSSETRGFPTLHQFHGSTTSSIPRLFSEIQEDSIFVDALEDLHALKRKSCRALWDSSGSI